MRQRGLAMVVKVPAADWMEHVGRSLARVHEWSDVFRRAGASRSLDKPEVGNDKVCDLLSSGRSVLGVSTAPERYLPSALLASADIRVDLGAPGSKVMALVIDLVTGTRPRKVPPGLGRGLSLTELASCIRKGSSAAACVRRLKEASVSKSGGGDQDLASVPLLEDCLGYGDAIRGACGWWRRCGSTSVVSGTGAPSRTGISSSRVIRRRQDELRQEPG